MIDMIASLRSFASHICSRIQLHSRRKASKSATSHPDIHPSKTRNDLSCSASCKFVFRLILNLKALNELPEELRKYLTKFRCRNHRLPIEIGCHKNVIRDMRICQHCRKDIGDEYHYLLCCP